MSTPLIIDTDVALGAWHDGRPRDIDDGFAIVEAMNLDEFNLIGITTVYGNAPLADTTRIAKELVRLKGVSVPVVPGADGPVPQDGPLTGPNEAVEFLANALARRPLKVAAIGPLTNIGLLAAHYPERMANIEELVIVAGRSPGRTFYIGSDGPVRDFNFENDVRAAQLALEAGVPTVLAGFELTSQVVITERDLTTIAARGTAVADYLHRNSIDWVRYWTRTFPVDTGFHPWDSAAIAWMLHPELFAAESRCWRIRVQLDEDDLDDGVHWLECDPEFRSAPVTYLSGFRPGGKSAFVQAVVGNVY
jgi:inosine-uridine nucleoside N-ribohydrolase